MLPGFVWAGGKKKGEPLPDEGKLVSAVDPVKRTFEITHQGHNVKTNYVFAPDVVILINGRNAQIKDVKVGLELFSYRLGTGMSEPAVIEELELITAKKKPR